MRIEKSILNYVFFLSESFLPSIRYKTKDIIAVFLNCYDQFLYLASKTKKLCFQGAIGTNNNNLPTLNGKLPTLPKL